MIQATATRRRRDVAYADTVPATGPNSVSYALVFVLIIGCITDVQGVVLLPLLGKMTEALHLSGAEVSWVINAPNIATAVMVGLAARSADIFGHRKMLIPMLSLGLVGSVLCALAPSFALLLVGRVVIGLCVCAPMSWAVLKIRSNEKGLDKAALYNGTLVAMMTPLGLVLGGVLLELGASWSSSFWIVGAGYLIVLVQVQFMPETPVRDRVRVPVDWLGSLGLGAWLVCFLLALSFGASWGWGSAAITALFIAGAVILAGWICQQRITPHALLDFKGMDVRQVTAGYGVFVTVVILGAGLYILEPGLAETPSVAGYGFGASVLTASMALLPILPASFLAAFISKRMLARVGPRPPIVLGGVLCLIAFVMMAYLHSTLWLFYPEVAIYGVGVVIAFSVGWALTASAGRQDNMSTTFGIQYALALPSGSLAVAILLAVETANVKVVPALGGAVVPKEGVYTGLFLMIAAVSLLGLVANGLFIVPRRLRHQSARLSEIIAAEGALERNIRETKSHADLEDANRSSASLSAAASPADRARKTTISHRPESRCSSTTSQLSSPEPGPAWAMPPQPRSPPTAPASSGSTSTPPGPRSSAT